jgi:hypothetical protein
VWPNGGRPPDQLRRRQTPSPAGSPADFCYATSYSRPGWNPHALERLFNRRRNSATSGTVPNKAMRCNARVALDASGPSNGGRLCQAIKNTCFTRWTPAKILRAFAAARSWDWPATKSGRPNRTSSVSDAQSAEGPKSLSATIEPRPWRRTRETASARRATGAVLGCVGGGVGTRF